MRMMLCSTANGYPVMINPARVNSMEISGQNGRFTLVRVGFEDIYLDEPMQQVADEWREAMEGKEK